MQNIAVAKYRPKADRAYRTRVHYVEAYREGGFTPYTLAKANFF